VSGARTLVVTPPELESGFRLAGVPTVPATSAAEALAHVEQALAAAMEGVVAVHEPFLDAVDEADRARFERSVAPVILPLPAGRGAPDEERRRARISAMLRRAVGYHITFGEEESV
jgi:vacuolar-type H+-ATPase subunit F/Vma7